MSKSRRSSASGARKPAKRVAAPRVARKGAKASHGESAHPLGDVALHRDESSDSAKVFSATQVPVAPGTAAILAIGDEVLRGEIANTNTTFLSDRLFDAGYDIRSHRTVSDTPADIRVAVEALASEASVVVVTGGLGPTEDDRTVDVVSSLLGVETVNDEGSLDAMKRRFAAHGFALTPNNLRQVRVPLGATVFVNSAGIAPGFCVGIGDSEVYFLPGIPREMESIFLTSCMPRLLARRTAQGVAKAAVRTFHIYGMGESHIDHRLAGLIEGVPEASLHFRTAAPENHVKVVIRTSDAARSKALLDEIDVELRKRIGQGIYGTDGETFPMVVGRTLREAGATLALAESCTAGYAGQLLTSEPGASDVFVGGVLAYADQVKSTVLGVRPELLTEHGAVSEPCARAMAEGVRKLTNATIAVAITGIAGAKMDGRPGATHIQASGEKPVGTVFFAVAGTRPTKSTTKLFSGDRESIRKAAAYYALDLARRYFS